MLIPRPRIHNANLDALAKDAPVVQLADARGVVRCVVSGGGGVPDGREPLDGREGHARATPARPSRLSTLWLSVSMLAPEKTSVS